MHCKDARSGGYPYKRSHLVALGATKISALCGLSRFRVFIDFRFR
jgi:hypothetical protein